MYVCMYVYANVHIHMCVYIYMHIYILYIYLLLPYLLVCKLYLILIEKKKKVLKSSHIILEDIKLAAGFGGVHKYAVGG